MNAWKIVSLPQVLWRKPWPALRLQHLQTTINRTENGLSGDAMWVGEGGVALGWEWIHVRRTIVAMADPLGIVCNVDLRDAAGNAVSEGQRAMFLNGLVRDIDWQGQVRKRIRDEYRLPALALSSSGSSKLRALSAARALPYSSVVPRAA